MFFLYMILFWIISVPGMAQVSNKLDQDSINYYLHIVDEGEQQVGRALAHIGFLYKKAGRYNSALDYFDRALPLLNEGNASLETAKIQAAKGVIYELFGDNAEPSKYYRLARTAYMNSARIIERAGNRAQQMSINQHLADLATKRGNFNRALIYQNSVMKALTELYMDSLQSQAESFNELLNQEIQSSKDTIYVESSEASKVGPDPIAVTNWRHFIILLLALGLIAVFLSWRSQRKAVQDLQLKVKSMAKDRRNLEQQNQELQQLNLKLTRTEKEQRMSSMTKDKIFSIISHDLRSPINTITGLLNILGAKMSTVGDVELRNLVKNVNESNEKLTHFLDDLLKWSMTQLGQLKPKVVKVDFKKLVQENYSLVKPRLQAKNIHFKASIPENIAVYADENMLRLILRNLISNSIKFTRNGGYIAVALKPGDDNTSIIEVSDDGIGMSEEKLQHLFEFRGSEINGGHHSQGTGLGLLLCKEFIELNGGQIEVTSSLRKGTKFTIKLPADPRAEN